MRCVAVLMDDTPNLLLIIGVIYIIRVIILIIVFIIRIVIVL